MFVQHNLRLHVVHFEMILLLIQGRTRHAGMQQLLHQSDLQSMFKVSQTSAGKLGLKMQQNNI
jgi:hypothetical protein